MSRQMKHSLRCQLLTMLRLSAFTACDCAERIQQPRAVVEALFSEMEAEGLITTTHEQDRYAIAAVSA